MIVWFARSDKRSSLMIPSMDQNASFLSIDKRQASGSITKAAREYAMRILIFQHLVVENPGVFLDFWRDAGHSWTVVELDAGESIPAFDDYDLLAVMGGPMDVWQEDRHAWLAPEKAAIRRWVEDFQRPYLGICLGHQLLAEALGGHVRPMRAAEVGIKTVELSVAGRADLFFRGLDAEIETLQWHGAEVVELPPGAEILAGNAACPVQAMRCGRHAYGVQFHVEITRDTVAAWNAIPEYKASLERFHLTSAHSRRA